MKSGVVLGALLAIAIVACGGDMPAPQRPDPRDNEITALWAQIRAWRKEAHMALDPTPYDVMSIGPRPFAEVKHVCPDHHHVPNTCNDVCNLADDICDNAERICDLADQLGKTDEYAQEKCRSAKASCRESKQHCCDCSTAADAGSASFGGGL